MKKKLVSKDPLAEKIEEILTPYPDPMSRNDFRIVCHIGTRTSLYLLQSGLVPCKNNGKKTRCYKIAKKDVAEYYDSIYQDDELSSRVKVVRICLRDHANRVPAGRELTPSPPG